MSYAYLDYLYVEIGLLAEDVDAVPLAGNADDACSELAEKQYIIDQLAHIPDEQLYNAVGKMCDHPEITSRKHAIEYIVWMAACNIQEENEWAEYAGTDEYIVTINNEKLQQ